MKTRATESISKLVLGLMVVLVLSNSQFGHADKLDLASQTLLIKKIESTLAQAKSAGSNVDPVGLKLQLANLYSEQGRLLVVEEGKANCVACKGSKKVRVKSIQLYKEVLPKLNGDFKAEVSLQLAHLYDLSGENEKSILIYTDIIKNSKQDTSAALSGKALIARGNSFFRKGQFIKAQSDFQAALPRIKKEEQGILFHKIAWSYYNLGEHSKAISQMRIILNDPKLLEQNSSEGYRYSEAQHAGFSHDLALFLAKSDISNSEIQELQDLSPNSARIENLLFLADECQRLDRGAGAIKVWMTAMALPEFPMDQKPTLRIKIARYYREHNNLSLAQNEFHQSLEEQQKVKFQAEASAEYKSLAKNYLATWDKQTQNRKLMIHKESLIYLLKAYQDYNAHFPGDVETLIWQAQLARDKGQNQLALQSYHQAADEAKTKRPELVEKALLAEIELAEKRSLELNNSNVKIQSYQHYLDLQPQGSRKWLVKFAMANAQYDLKKFSESAEIYHEVAKGYPSQKNADSMALKSAHLHLDSLAHLNQSEVIETAALQYAVLFSQDKNIFYRVARKAALKQVYELAKSQELSDFKKALRKLETVNLQGANLDEQIQYFKLQIDLAEKTQQIGLAVRGVESLLKIKGITSRDRVWALTKKMGLAELRLDFGLAYDTALLLKMDQSPRSSDLIQVLTFAEFSGRKVNSLVDRILSGSAPRAQKSLAAVIKIKHSAQPWKDLALNQRNFKGDKNVLSEVLLDVFIKTQDFQSLEKYLKSPGLLKSHNGLTLWRLYFLKHLGQTFQEIQNTPIVTSSEKLLNVSLKKRLHLFKDLQNQIRVADFYKDWSAQVMSRSLVRAESLKLANQIQGFPAPKGLRAKDLPLYKKALSDQAQTFIATAKTTSQQLDVLWNNQSAVNELAADVRALSSSHLLYVSEAKAVAKVAPDHVKQILTQALSEPSKRPSYEDSRQAREKVQHDPFDVSALTQLIEIEKNLDHPLFVTYLSGRVQSLNLNVTKSGVVK